MSNFLEPGLIQGWVEEEPERETERRQPEGYLGASRGMMSQKTKEEQVLERREWSIVLDVAKK